MVSTREVITGFKLQYYNATEDINRTVSIGRTSGSFVGHEFTSMKTPVMGVYGTSFEDGISSLGWIYYDIECKEPTDGSGVVVDRDRDFTSDKEGEGSKEGDGDVNTAAIVTPICFMIILIGGVGGGYYWKKKRSNRVVNIKDKGQATLRGKQSDATDDERNYGAVPQNTIIATQPDETIDTGKQRKTDVDRAIEMEVKV